MIALLLDSTGQWHRPWKDIGGWWACEHPGPCFRILYANIETGGRQTAKIRPMTESEFISCFFLRW